MLARSPNVLTYICRYVKAPHEELVQAAAEQMRITERRLAALLGMQPAAAAAAELSAGALQMPNKNVCDPRRGAIALQPD